ncbi:hypothetical protein PR048_027028 [Dryococelus australis]|uniref:Uncharacterized protein n=1 Tax=Dryococelus australis TaxID=614101 RepID=A0ABQ9GMZ5_9NEOP|nr:hypothetical protein PR048_027028 [Dryococelus australis]
MEGEAMLVWSSAGIEGRSTTLHRPARFPRAKMREGPRRESNPVHVGIGLFTALKYSTRSRFVVHSATRLEVTTRSRGHNSVWPGDVYVGCGQHSHKGVHVISQRGEEGSVSQWLENSRPTKANQVQFLVGSHPDIRRRESYRTMPLVGGFSQGSPFLPDLGIPQLLHIHLASPTSALKNADVKSHQKHSSPLAIQLKSVHDHSPPTLANRVQLPMGSLPDSRMWQSCRTMPLVGRLYLGSPPPPNLIMAPLHTSITLIGSQDLAVKSRPNISTPLSKYMS